MRILLVCQHYWPEPFNTSDVCEELARRGHEVTVLTGLPNTGLPGNRVLPEYARGQRRLETRNGVTIRRVGLHPRKHGAVNRVWNYLSFWGNGLRAAQQLEDRFDVVIGYQFSPVMQVDPAVRFCQRTGTPLLLYCFDLWPESLCAGGFRRGGLAYNWMKKVSTRIYASADAVAVTSPLFKDYFSDTLGLQDLNIMYLPQYAEDQFGALAAAAASSFPEGYQPGKVNLTFAGNVGVAQSVQTIVDAAELLAADQRILLHVVGSGAMLDACKAQAQAKGLTNLVFHGRKPFEDMPAYYAASDGMLVTLADDQVISYTLPRKVQSYMAAGRPVIAAAGGEAQRVIQASGCGYCCKPADASALAEACQKFANTSSQVKAQMGANGREFYNTWFSRERFFQTLESSLEQVQGSHA